MSIQEKLNVSRETLAALQVYADLLVKWNPRINLVSRSTLADLWTRHILDSAQVYQLAPHPVGHWVDLGTGGGFPGLVIAIMAKERKSPTRTTLVESDTRKSAFLRTVIRETGAPATVITDRIENVAPLQADVLSARALADLSSLLSFTETHMKHMGIALFPKGVTWEKELQEAQIHWKFDHQLVNSQTEAGPVILNVSGVSRV